MAISRAQTWTNLRRKRPKPRRGIGGVARPAERQARIDAVVAVAERHAEAVDREARLPKEACAELRAQRLLSLLLSDDCGGEAATISDVARNLLRARPCVLVDFHDLRDVCTRLMSPASRVAGDSNATFVDYLRRIGVEQLLVVIFDDRRPERRQCAHERVGDRLGRGSDILEPGRVCRVL